MSIFIRNVPSIRLIFNTLYSIFSIFPIFPKDQYGRNGIPHWSCFSDAHTREAQQIWGTSPILPLPEREARGWFCEEPKNTAAPNVTSLTEGCNESSLHMLCLLVFPNLTHHHQCILTLVAWLSFLSSLLVKTGGGTPLTGGTWIVSAKLRGRAPR